ncbi:MAG: hypothetical protein A3C71_00675 [Candidatus Yanofskybacteria bacterium RIFCSPHIGHO2_02_FULL_43_15c]|uniref:Uncharacterized protein n=2 Tax=Candidatus Yanofskyibacteriota TaxID=1752733 RepID=A0A1F8H7E8_9BACT|nr:MAG: hypothetical protein A3C71_00675 [Candidatus Yanofskybacteria bacterium RIFCSPHIGHO2_02_FULL_43_15c]OGN32839.1 MAG: hypothetical protein A3I92_00785 [Candidatus Yanofskybacteria bacterium RIFCSPLOWO2_02_FULL_43_10b]
MDLNEIQKLIEELGAAVIVGEEGPKMIAMSYDTYKNMAVGRGNGVSRENRSHFVPAITDHDRLTFPEQLAIRAEKSGNGEQELVEKLNQDIAILKEEIKKKELGEM